MVLKYTIEIFKRMEYIYYVSHKWFIFFLFFDKKILKAYKFYE
jgi:hypothetical protein